MIAFDPNGPLLSFTSAANSAAAALVAVQAITKDNVLSQQIKLVNTDATNDAVVGWGPDAATAAFNALATNGSQNCTFLLHNTVEIVTVPSQSFVTAILAAGTPVIKVQAGYGKK